MSNAGKGNIIEEEYTTVRVMLMKSMILKMVGHVTGKEYIFNGGGSIVEIDIEDMDYILEHNQSTPSCCGSYSSPNFEVLGR
jgi:hypothetical protein